MSINAVEKIRDAELLAEKKEVYAKNEAEAIVSKAVSDAAAIVEKAKADGEKHLADAVSAAKTASGEKGVACKKKTEEVLKQMETAAEAKMKDAAALVKKKLIS